MKLAQTPINYERFDAIYIKLVDKDNAQSFDCNYHYNHKLCHTLQCIVQPKTAFGRVSKTCTHVNAETDFFEERSSTTDAR